MGDFDHIQVSYRTDPTWDTVIREVNTQDGTREQDISAASAHSTLTEVREAVEQHELNVGRVERVVLGAEEYEDLLAYAVLQRDPGDVTDLGRLEGVQDFDPRESVERLLKKDVTVVPGSEILAVGSPNDQLIQKIRDEVADERE